MSLRRSPTRTPALLAANRSNARRSTGPRTPEGKCRSALNALKHGYRAQAFDTLLAGPSCDQFTQLRQAVWEAVDPRNGSEQRAVDRVACVAWTAKREIGRRIASPAGRALHFGPRGTFPRPFRLRFNRPQWRVTVSVWMRRGRGKQGQQVPLPARGWKEGQRTLHLVVTVTASMGHPSCRLSRGPLGFIALRKVFRTKPESYRKQAYWKYDIVPKSIPFPRRSAWANSGRRPSRWLDRAPAGVARQPQAESARRPFRRLRTFFRRLLGNSPPEGAPRSAGRDP